VDFAKLKNKWAFESVGLEVSISGPQHQDPGPRILGGVSNDNGAIDSLHMGLCYKITK